MMTLSLILFNSTVMAGFFDEWVKYPEDTQGSATYTILKSAYDKNGVKLM